MRYAIMSKLNDHFVQYLSMILRHEYNIIYFLVAHVMLSRYKFLFPFATCKNFLLLEDEMHHNYPESR